jgi:ubiquinone/menaquinone biosynthesis C-methylase UbiE/uncharacterized protein YbaR (Trm112 family)
MKEFLFNILVCPSCNGKLKIENAEYSAGEIKSGVLFCACGRRYPIKNSIPRFVESDGYVNNFSFEWNRFNKTQLDSFNKTAISKDRFKDVTGYGPEDLKGKVVLEIGCGMGRFMEIAAKSAKEVVGIDLSFSVDAARDNLKHLPNTHVIQANVFNLPLAQNKFDLIYSIGVLHHTPDPKKAFLSLPGLLSKNGNIAIWYSPRSIFPLLPKATSIARIFTTRMRPECLFNFLNSFVPLVLPFVRLPFIGRFLKGWVFPICDYKNELPLNKEQLLEWSILDTFDLLSPKYLYPHSADEIKSWFKEAGFSNIVSLKPDVTVRSEELH